MTLFMPHLRATVEKVTEQHPWSNQIKDLYSNKIKYAHNSVRNPTYPQKNIKEKITDAELTKFTIIGDRVTEEFTYCVNLVKGLHKYRKKRFKAPEIRGLTTVEWPVVHNDLKIRFGELAYCLKSSVAVLFNDEFLGGEIELKNLVENKYSYHLSLDYYKEAVAEFAKFINGSGRPCVFMHIAIDDEHIGTLIFMLYSDIVPNTSENFLRLCKETRGGYSGTPIHRIVKDGWIQGGGFGLKDTHLDCENFSVPHDRRGVLGMANDGRHKDCSTQFFVLLQPAPWMSKNYVAFGQLIEGKNTLEKIEAVPTWYEAPTSQIVIYKSGIFNMECQNVTINKGANEYIDGHIEDLNALGELLIQVLMEQVFLTAELREIERLKEVDGEGGEHEIEDDGVASVRETQRFNRNKEDMEKQLQYSKLDTKGYQSALRRPDSGSVGNMDFDVETYDPELETEETDYIHQSVHTPSLVVKPQKPYYIPLTDNLYPGEKDSNFNLRRFLQGDYCLEGDLVTKVKRYARNQQRASYSSTMFEWDETESESEDEEELDSDDEKEIEKYLKFNTDRVSFAGSVVKKIAKGYAKLDLRSEIRKSELITDDQLRRLRLASLDYRAQQRRDKKVSISINLPCEKDHHSKIKRRTTGFVRPEDMEKIRVYSKSSVQVDDADDDDDDDEDSEDDEDSANRKVRIADTGVGTGHGITSGRRPTGYVRTGDIDIDDDDDESNTEVRQSVLVRLFDDVKGDDEPPTLKDYKPSSESHQKGILLKFSSNYRIKSDESTKERYLRQSLTVGGSYERVLNLQHGKRASRKISTDYVKTIDQMEQRPENSIRSVEFAKTRPAMSVAEYQMRNKMYQDSKKLLKRPSGLRLPGDSPLYSSTNGMFHQSHSRMGQ